MKNSISRRVFAIAVPIIFTGFPAQANAPAGQYTVTAETVLDNKTGLTWQRNPPQVAGDDGNGDYILANAKSYCAGLTINGVNQWRVPTLKELFTLIDFRATAGSMIDSTTFPNVAYTTFWSTTAWSIDASQAWSVNFQDGSTAPIPMTSKVAIRCVR